MKGYGQFCPIAKAAELFCERWTALVIRNLGAGATRFSDIQRGVPLMSSSLLSRRLRQLEAEGILERRRSARGQSWTYHLTEAGREFLPLVAALGAWGERWTRRDLVADEMDLGLLIWGLEFTVDPDALGPGRRVLRLEFTDLPAHKRYAWFVCEEGSVELCVTDPGYDTDLFAAASLRDMIHLYRGDLVVRRALDEERLALDGPRALCQRFAAWLNKAPSAEPARPGRRVGPVRSAAG